MRLFKDIIRYVNLAVVYIGGSAGFHIASESIKHIEKYGDNNVEMTDLKGLGLFDGVFVIVLMLADFCYLYRKIH